MTVTELPSARSASSLRRSKRVTAVAGENRKCIDDGHDGKRDLRRGKADFTHGLSEENRVDDVIERVEDDGCNSGNGELEHELANGRRAHAGDFVLPLLLTLLELFLSGHRGICFVFVHVR